MSLCVLSSALPTRPLNKCDGEDDDEASLLNTACSVHSHLLCLHCPSPSFVPRQLLPDHPSESYLCHEAHQAIKVFFCVHCLPSWKQNGKGVHASLVSAKIHKVGSGEDPLLPLAPALGLRGPHHCVHLGLASLDLFQADQIPTHIDDLLLRAWRLAPGLDFGSGL